MLKFLLLSVLISSCTSYSQLDCPDLFDVFIYDLCYRVYKTPANFTEAKKTCNDYYRPLAVIRNGVQASYLTSWINAETGVNNGAYWIGLQRATNTSKFFWDDGTAMHWNLWNFGSPGTKYNQVASSTLNGRWMTMDETEKHVFACSFDPSTRKSTTTSTVTEETSTSTTTVETTVDV